MSVARGLVGERSTLGNPMKYTMCFAEWEERNPWSPLHVERGFRAEVVVTVFTMSGPTLIVDQIPVPDPVGRYSGSGLQTVFGPKAYFATDCLLVVVPEHVDTFARDNYGKRKFGGVFRRSPHGQCVNWWRMSVLLRGLKPRARQKWMKPP